MIQKEKALTWLTLARTPKPCSLDSSPTNMIGSWPVDSENSAMLEDAGADGLNVPAASTPDETSVEKAIEDTIPNVINNQHCSTATECCNAWRRYLSTHLGFSSMA